MVISSPPVSRTCDQFEELGGLRFPDPYRWLEDSTEEVEQWQYLQNELATDVVKHWPHLDALKARIEHFHVSRVSSTSRQAGDRSFQLATEGACAGCILVRVPSEPSARVLFDPKQESGTSPPVISWFSPSPDGKTLALGACTDGSENNTVRLIDVDTGERLSNEPSQVLMDAWMGGAHWLPDSSGFFYTALTGLAEDFTQEVFLHRIGEAPPQSPEAIPFPTGSRDYRAVTISRCGRWAVANFGMLLTRPVALLDLHAKEPCWRPFVNEFDCLLAGHVVGEQFVAVTDVNAPLGRVVAIALNSVTANDPSTWDELICESHVAIRSVFPIGNELYVTGHVDTYSSVRRFPMSGRDPVAIPLPWKGAILEAPFPLMRVVSFQPTDAYVFGFSSLTESRGIYRYRSGTDHFETLAAPVVCLDGAVVDDHWAVANDGERVAYHCVRRADVDMTRPHPTLIIGYGAYGVTFEPQYPGVLAAFVEAGGILVHSHLRGGGEFGRDWWHGGARENKQQSYDDLFSVAEDVIRRGLSTPALLGVMGGSSGGLMAAVAVVQRPELWRVSVPCVPILDLIGAMRTRYGQVVWDFEFGDPTEASVVRRVAAFSPYQAVTDGKKYPATYLSAGENDPRCPAWHARKFAARLQAAQGGEAPIVLHVWGDAGHGWATPRRVELAQQTEMLAFVMQTLGLVPRGASAL
ncbi:Prolyl endopeptidase [Pandoraea horticolens]|uniref:prolyl oligopeptidase n=1 Tax=Pandoraea horticolens TaxID=2508298 RepID=A0A5E4VS18_9BURK|nr:prolyl oligopeptidase family serine peptidase [Pandoraea horticolens]VVE14064.1 Prolyl endopeptidase [Pandoraea horticolens]